MAHPFQSLALIAFLSYQEWKARLPFVMSEKLQANQKSEEFYNATCWMILKCQQDRQ
jgi:hypothetical protein